MSSLLSLRSSTFASWTYDTEGTLLFSYDLPLGSIESSTADTLRTSYGNPDGSVWMGIHTAAGSPVPQLKRVNPRDGTTYETITLAGLSAGTDTIAGGDTLQRNGAGDFLLVVNKGAANELHRYGADGADLQTYSIPAGTMAQIGLAIDGTTLYYRLVGASVLNRWNLTTDTALDPFGDLGSHWTGTFKVMPDNGVLAVMDSVTINAQRFTSNNALVASYTPSDAFAQSHGKDVMYDVSLGRVYVATASGSGSVAGTLAAYPLAGTTFASPTPIWSVRVPLFGGGNAVERAMMAPPLGAARAFPATTTAQQPILRARICPHLSRELLVQFYSKMQLDMQVGSPLSDGTLECRVGLAFSDDGGHTWSAIDWIDAGAQGEYVFRVMWQQLGSARDRVFAVYMSSAVPVAWLQALIDVTSGIS